MVVGIATIAESRLNFLMVTSQLLMVMASTDDVMLAIFWELDSNDDFEGFETATNNEKVSIGLANININITNTNIQSLLNCKSFLNCKSENIPRVERKQRLKQKSLA